MFTPTQWHMIFTGLCYIHLVVSIDAYEEVSHAGSNHTNTTVPKTDHFSVFGFSTLHSILVLAGAGLVLSIIIVIIIVVALKHSATVEDEDKTEDDKDKTVKHKDKPEVKGSKYCIVCQGEEPA